MTRFLLALAPAAAAIALITLQVLATRLRWRREDRALGCRLHEAGRRRAARAAMDARHPLRDDHAGDLYLCWLEPQLPSVQAVTEEDR